MLLRRRTCSCVITANLQSTSIYTEHKYKRHLNSKPAWTPCSPLGKQKYCIAYLYRYPELTSISSFCLLFTPLPSTIWRCCTHSNGVVSANSKWNQSNNGWRRWSCGGSFTAPKNRPSSFVLYPVPTDWEITLGRSPTHYQTRPPTPEILRQRNTGHLGRGFQTLHKIAYIIYNHLNN